MRHGPEAVVTEPRGKALPPAGLTKLHPYATNTSKTLCSSK